MREKERKKTESEREKKEEEEEEDKKENENEKKKRERDTNPARLRSRAASLLRGGRKSSVIIVARREVHLGVPLIIVTSFPVASRSATSRRTRIGRHE